MSTCGLCGGQLDDLALELTVEVAPGRRGTRHYSEVTTRLEDFRVCWACLGSPESKNLARMLADEYMEPVIEDPPPLTCHATCAGGRRMASRHWWHIFSVRAGSRGEPEAWARCPVCLGPCEVERTA